MITRITKENREKYVKLFAKATEALEKSEVTLVDPITNLELYFNNIEQLFELDPRFIRLPLDEEAFNIDLNTRQITIPDSFKKSGLGVQGDDMAETIYFRCDRFFDMTDLSNENILIVIQWEAPNGEKMASPAYFKDIDSETDKLIFGWAITGSMTNKPGTLKFSVIFIDGEMINAENNELSIEGLEYRLGTLSSSINIQSGLNIAANGKINFEDRLLELKKRIKNTPILGGITEGVAALAEILPYNGFDWKSEKIFENIFTDLVDDPTKPGEETGLTMLAVSPNAGLISYSWRKEGSEEVIEGPAAIRFFPVKQDAERRQEAIYFIKEGDENFRYFDEGKDYWFDDNGKINPLLHERVAFYPVEGPGTYYVEVTHKEGRKTPSVLNTKENGGIAIIPAPTEIAKVEIVSNTDIFEEGKDLEISSKVEFVNENPYEKLSYQWYKRTPEGDVAIENANEAVHNVIETGNYVLKVVNNWNKASVEKMSDNVIRIYLSAVEPTGVTFTSSKWLVEEERVSERAPLTVSFDPINQEEAKQYVRWEVDYTPIDGEEHFEEISNEDGTPFEGLTYEPKEAGNYRVTIYNEITENNRKYAITDVIRVI